MLSLAITSKLIFNTVIWATIGRHLHDNQLLTLVISVLLVVYVVRVLLLLVL